MLNLLDKHYKENKSVILTLALLMFLSIIIVLFSQGKKEEQKIKFYEPKKIKLSNASTAARAEDRWLEKSENEIEDLQSRLEFVQKENSDLKEQIKTINENIADLTRIAAEDKLQSSGNVKIGYREDNSLIQKVEKKQFQDPFLGGNLSNSQSDNFELSNSLPRGIMSVSILETTDDSVQEYKNTENYLPAGSYAPAILTSGVEASVGISSQSDPRPVLFRVTDYATGPIFEGEKQRIDIRGCTVTGAASGDLSSEKVYIRLLKMTCARGEKELIELDVEGYAAALGRSGIRGPVISREGDFVTKSFFAGLVGGIGNGVATKLATNNSFADGVLTSEISSSDIAASGFADGLSNSADMLSEYLINRAEQYQPVISIPAGIAVELVFHTGVSLKEDTT